MTRAKYEPFDYYDHDNPMSPGNAYIQAGMVLDMAAKQAVQSKDMNAMLTVSVRWQELAESMITGGTVAGSDAPPVHTGNFGGFVIRADETEQYAEEDYDDEQD